FHLIVETLQGSVRDPQCGPGENSFHMRADKLSKFLHGFQTTVRRLPEPVEKKAFGVEPAFVMPEELKGFLQSISAVESQIQPRQIEQRITLGICQIPGVIHHDKARAYNNVMTRSRPTPDPLAADFNDGIEQ